MVGPIGSGSSQGQQLLKTALFVGGSLLVVVVFLLTQSAVSRLTKEVSATSELLAKVAAQATIPSTINPQVQRVLGELAAGISFPIVITDITGTPRAWSHLSVRSEDVSPGALDSLAAGLAIPPAVARRVQIVKDQANELDRTHKPIPLRQSPNALVMGFLHYGNPPVLEQLRWMPLIAVAGTGLLLLLGLSGLAGIRAAEKRVIWVGMAKETAHQLGTPLSSLMGWVELLRAHAESGGPGDTVTLGREELAETLSDMEGDIDRLNKVAQRFSHIGSAARLQPTDVTPTVRRVVHYMRRRLPKSGGEVEIRERYDEVPPVNLNPELLEWAVENLISNALSALDKRPGRIDVEVGRRPQSENVEIVIRDNGRGMSREEQRRAFEPGYTTRSRGWGLGLALVRRVVQDYHGGKLAIRQSVPGQGTTMVISFPT